MFTQCIWNSEGRRYGDAGNTARRVPPSLTCHRSAVDISHNDPFLQTTVEPGYMGLRCVGYLSMWDSILRYGETSFACTSPGYVGHLGWALECSTYPGSTVILLRNGEYSSSKKTTVLPKTCLWSPRRKRWMLLQNDIMYVYGKKAIQPFG